MYNTLIFGKNATEGIVNVEVKNGRAKLHFNNGDSAEMDYRHWILCASQYNPKLAPLQGNQHYKWYVDYDNQERYYEVLKTSREKRYDFWTIYNQQEAFMVKEGFTYFKGLRVEDVSVLSFDIETTGITHDENSKVLLISNTFKHNGQVKRKLFTYDGYASSAHMIDDWAKWVREINPSVITGHNILGFDLPYMAHCTASHGHGLRLGRDGSSAVFASRTSQFRKDGSQTYDYHNVHIYGREIVDTFFLSIKYDIGRKYESYGLKQIIKQESLDRSDREFYDASKIRTNYKNPEEWEKIKRYCEHDADDSLALYDLMIPSFFYYTQSIPRSLQSIINSATGSQVNSFMTRSYLQMGHSIPKSSDPEEYEGGISYGNPGIYKNVQKVDVASLYPSIILERQIYDKIKDPNRHFLQMVEYFTTERLSNKRSAKETGDRYYKDLEQAQKIMINSAYGFLGAPGLIYNSPKNAALVTKTGREILQKGIKWAESKGWTIVNVDTDSFSYSTGKVVKPEEFTAQIAELNSLYPARIRWEDDGQYKVVLVVKAKNYVLYDGKKMVIKGSGLKGTMKETALQDFMTDVITAQVKGKKDHIYAIYQQYAHEIKDIRDIGRWCSKKTITKSILKPERTNEQRVLDALTGVNISEGDKVYMFFKHEDELCLREHFDGIYDKDKLYKKLYKTLDIFNTVLDTELFPDYSLKRNKELLDG